MSAARKARIDSGLTVKQIAKWLEVSESTVRGAERLGTPVSFDLAARLGKVIGCPADVYLFKSALRVPAPLSTAKKDLLTRHG